MNAAPEKWTFNHASLKDMLRELNVDFKDSHKEFVMHCFFTPECEGGKRALYLNCDEKAGIFHCFKCGTRGYIDMFVRVFTGWSEFRVIAFIMQHQAYFNPDDVVERTYEVIEVNERVLKDFAYRHAYCYDRGLTEETLRRYKIGYDRNENEIIFPWYAADGTLVAIKKRAVLNKYYRFMPTEEFTPTLFGINLIRPDSIIWITEGEFDGMFVDQTLRQDGFQRQGATALGGKDIQTKVLYQLMSKQPCAVVDALDNDADGQEASRRLQQQLSQYVPCYRMQYEGEAKDPNASSTESIARQAQRVERLVELQRERKHSTRYERWRSGREQ